MVDPRCRKCRYYGFSGGLGWTCDYLVITGRSRTGGLTKEEKLEPCRVFEPGKRMRRIEGIAYSRNGRFTYDQQKIRKMYFEGLNDTEIARRVGCVSSTVRLWRKRHDLPPNVPAKGKKARGDEQRKEG